MTVKVSKINHHRHHHHHPHAIAETSWRVSINLFLCMYAVSKFSEMVPPERHSGGCTKLPLPKHPGLSISKSSLCLKWCQGEQPISPLASTL